MKKIGLILLSFLLLFHASCVYSAGEFITTWKTDNPGSTAANQIYFRTPGLPGENFNIFWGDGTSNLGVNVGMIHTYPAPGTYTVTVTGTLFRTYFENSGDYQKLLSVEQWGNIPWTSMNSSYYNASNVSINAVDAPDLSGVTDMALMFGNATSFNDDISFWDVSNITNMSSLFHNTPSFNQPLNSWDMSNVTSIGLMFHLASSFNQPLNLWNTSNVTSTTGTFWGATSFNQDLSSWDMSSVTDMSDMFRNATSFDQDISSWDVSSVTTMARMFNGAGLSSSNYDALLTAWSALPPQPNVVFDAGDSQFCTAAAARSTLINTYNWTIYDDGPCPSSPSLSTASSSLVTDTSALLSGHVGSYGGGDITERGFEYGTTLSYGSSVNETGTFNFSPIYNSQFGTTGSGNGQFNFPFELTIDASDNIYVVDRDNDRIQKFNSSGVYVSQFGTPGTGDGQFGNAVDIALDSLGNIYVVDAQRNRVQKFDSNGVYVSKFGTFGAGNGQFNTPYGIALDSSDNIYVVDRGNNRVQKFNSSGVYVSKFGAAGSGNGQFSFARDIAFDSAGNIFIVDRGNDRIQKFNSSGVYVSQFGDFGTGDGEFDFPFGITIDDDDNIYVADRGNNRIQKFDSTHEYITEFGSTGAGNGQFDEAHAVALNSSGDLYVVDRVNNRVQKLLNSHPNFSLSATGLSCGTLYHYRPYAVNVSGTGYGSDQTFTTSACVGAPVSSGGSSSSGSTREHIRKFIEKNNLNITPEIIPPIIPEVPIIPSIVSPLASIPTTPIVPAIPLSTTTNFSEGQNQETAPSLTNEKENVTSESESNLNSSIVPPSLPINTEEVVRQNSTSSKPKVLGERSWFFGIKDNIENNNLATRDILAINLVALALVSVILFIDSTLAKYTVLTSKSDVWLALSGRLINIFSFFGIKRNKKDWGTVYDSESKQPLAPALVELVDSDTGSVKERTITNIWGKFGFITNGGNFILRSEKMNYSFPSKINVSVDGIYDNLYFGDVIHVDGISSLILPNIPMDPLLDMTNRGALTFKIKNFFSRLFTLFFWSGFVLSIVVLWLSQHWVNVLVFIFYIVFILYNYFIGRPRLWGRILNTKDETLDGFKVTLTRTFNGISIIVGKAIINPLDGKFFLKATPGEYTLDVVNNRGEVRYSGSVEISKNGVLNTDIFV